MHLAFSKLLSKGDKREREWGYNLCSDSGSPGRAKIWPWNIRVKFSREKLGAYWRKEHALRSFLQPCPDLEPSGALDPKSSWLPLEGTHTLDLSLSTVPLDTWHPGHWASLQPSLLLSWQQASHSEGPLPVPCTWTPAAGHVLLDPGAAPVCLLSDGLVWSRRRGRGSLETVKPETSQQFSRLLRLMVER